MAALVVVARAALTGASKDEVPRCSGSGFFRGCLLEDVFVVEVAAAAEGPSAAAACVFPDAVVVVEVSVVGAVCVGVVKATVAALGGAIAVAFADGNAA